MTKQEIVERIKKNFPAEMQARPQWVAWRIEVRDDKPTKVPYSQYGIRAHSDKPATWTKFEAACNAYLSGDYSGVGYMFFEHDPYAGVDFDKCVTSGVIEPEKLYHIDLLDSYAEFSQSGTGVHVIVRGLLPPGRRKSNEQKIEMYDHLRFFVVTGDVIGGFPTTVNDRQAQLEHLHASLFPKQVEQTQRHADASPVALDDQTLLDTMFASKNGAKIRSLYDGSLAGYDEDRSAADLALCNYLAFWTGNDAARIDSLFRQSRLYRDKWGHQARTGETYGAGTIARAIDATTEVYTPPKPREEKTTRVVDPDTGEILPPSTVAPKAYTNGNGTNHASDADYAKPAEASRGEEKPMSDILLTEGAHDEGNAQCVHHRYDGKFLQSEALGWLAHTGTHWTMDEADAKVERAITETLIARAETSLKSGKPDAELIKRCVPNSGRVQGAKSQLRSLVSISPHAFDNEPDLLNCRNGVVDLRTGDLHPHKPEQRFMHCTTVDYDPDTNYDIWSNWLIDTVGADMENWLQIAVGYSLTGHTREEVMFYLFGPPRSGKGTFTETILDMLGSPLADVIGFHTLTAPSDADTQNFNLAPLHNARFIAASESNAYERFNEAKVKLITGGDKIQCSFKHKTPFSYRPKYKIWLSSNQPVNADPDDDATWGRLRVIKLPHSHLGTEDKALKQTMRSADVLKGVLAWAILGAIRWYQLGAAGLPELKESSVEKKEQREALDNVQGWIGECCLIGSGGFTANSILYLSYERWCKENGIEPKKQKGFSQALIRKGFKDERKTTAERKTVRGFAGIGLA